MNEPFVLEVNYRGEMLALPAAFQRYGYTYRIAVSIDEIAYIFEPDEEGSYRVLGDTARTPVDMELLKVVAKRLEKLQ